MLCDGTGLQTAQSHFERTPHSCGLQTVNRTRELLPSSMAEGAPQGPRSAHPRGPLRQPIDATTRASSYHARSIRGGPRRAEQIVLAPRARLPSSSVAAKVRLPSFRRWPDQVFDASLDVDLIAQPPSLEVRFNLGSALGLKPPPVPARSSCSSPLSDRRAVLVGAAALAASPLAAEAAPWDPPKNTETPAWAQHEGAFTDALGGLPHVILARRLGSAVGAGGGARDDALEEVAAACEEIHAHAFRRATLLRARAVAQRSALDGAPDPRPGASRRGLGAGALPGLGGLLGLVIG